MNSPLFIVGCDRSGTTLLSLIINKSPNFHVTLESGFLPKLRERAEEYGDFSKPRQRWYFIRDLQYTNATSKTFAFDIFDISDIKCETAIRDVAPTNYVEACRAVFRADAEEAGATRWANKTPKYVQHIDWLADAFPDAQFIHIIRDPRDVSASLIETGWHSTYREAARYWKKQVCAGRKLGSRLSGQKYDEVSYEKLVLNPIQEVKRLSEWLNIDLGEEALQFYETAGDEISDEHKYLFPLIDQPIDPSRAYAWKNEVRERSIADVEEEVGSIMENLGYSLSGAEVPLWAQGMRRGRKKVISVGRKVKQVLQRAG